MSKIESYSEFLNSYKIAEAEKQADENQKIKDFMDKASEEKEKAREAKLKYDEVVKDKSKENEAEILLLQYKKHKASAELNAAEAKLMKKGIKDNEE